MNTYLVTGKLHINIVEAETVSEAWAADMVSMPKLKYIGLDNDEIQSLLTEKGYKTMNPTELDNVFLLK